MTVTVLAFVMASARPVLVVPPELVSEYADRR